MRTCPKSEMLCSSRSPQPTGSAASEFHVPSEVENQAMASPTRKRETVRRSILRQPSADHLPPYLRSEAHADTPMMNMKNGKTRSVGVSPVHSAWRSGA